MAVLEVVVTDSGTSAILAAIEGMRTDLQALTDRVTQLELHLAEQRGADLGRRLDDETRERKALEVRVRTLEVWRGWLLGGLGLAGSGVALLAVKIILSQ
jgi:hypothetical protein